MKALLLTEREVAERLQVHRDTLRRWRKEGEGPPWWNLAPHRDRPVVRYDAATVEAWLERQREGGNDQ